MSILVAGNNETPDTGQGGLAVTGNVNTGHGSTTCSVTIGPEESNSQTKTCRWFDFLHAQFNPIKLQFNWSLSGSLTLTGAAPDSTVANALFRIEYSKDFGATWATALERSYTQTTNGTQSLSDSGSVDVEITGAFYPDEIRVRDTIRADATSTLDPTVSASASITAALDTLQLEATPLNSGPIVMM